MPGILLLQGANMNFLGLREPEKYGRTSAEELDQMARDYARAKNFDLEIFYTNTEGAMIDKLYEAHHAKVDAVVMNPAGFCYSAFALRDCIRGINVPVIEVHMTNHYERGIHSVTGAACIAVFTGGGIQVYFRGIDAALEIVREAAV